jgi:hypothetical protein
LRSESPGRERGLRLGEGSTAMESRIKKIETMMETLISMQTGVRLGHSLRASEESEHIGNINDYQGLLS